MFHDKPSHRRYSMNVTALEQRTGSAAFDHQNAELVQTLYRSLRARDLEAAAELIYPDFVAHVPGKGINAGEYWSVEGFKTLFSNVLAYNGGHFDVRVPVVSVNGADVFTREVIELNGTADPERIWTLPVSMHYKIKAGKISEMWVLPEDQRLYDDYWSGPAATGGATSSAPASAGQLARSQPTEISIEGASSARNLDLHLATSRFRLNPGSNGQPRRPSGLSQRYWLGGHTRS
jgi:ketosteroid isomerase-like protein